jgi:hypothetical protein
LAAAVARPVAALGMASGDCEPTLARIERASQADTQAPTDPDPGLDGPQRSSPRALSSIDGTWSREVVSTHPGREMWVSVAPRGPPAPRIFRA